MLQCVSEMHSILRLLVDPTLPCALFAYPYVREQGTIRKDRPVDVLIGFLDATKKRFTFAYDDGRVYPMVCHHVRSTYAIPDAPKGTKWVVAASLPTDLRQTVTLGKFEV